MIKKEMNHILGRDVAYETLSNVKKIDNDANELKKKLDDIYNLLNDANEIINENFNKLHYIQKNTEISKEYLSNEYITLYNKKNEEKPRVLICGFYGAKNVGDELMLEALLKLIPKESLDVTVLLSNNYDLDASEYMPYKILHYPKHSSDIVAIAENYDAVIWGGGAMLDDLDYVYRGQYSTMAYILISITKAILKKGGHAFIYGISTNNEITDESFIEDLNYIIRHSDYFSLRDTNSLLTLKKANINVDKIDIIDDLSIYNLFDKNFCKKDQSVNNKCIGLNLILYEERLPEYERIIKNIANHFKGLSKILLIPFYSYNNNDQLLLEKIINKIGKNTVELEIVKQPNNTDELLSIYKECDYIFAMRYHAVLIAALTQRHVVMIDFQKVHRHYVNKNAYIKTKYAPNLSVVDYDKLCRSGLPKTLIPELDISSELIKEIANNIKKKVQDSLKTIRRQG